MLFEYKALINVFESVIGGSLIAAHYFNCKTIYLGVYFGVTSGD